jgi:L-malate glycosyltransferase
MNASPSPATIIHLSTGTTLRGGERQALWLHQGLLEKGWNSRIVCRSNGELSRHAAPSLISIPWRGEWDIAGLVRILGVCKTFRPDIIHCHDAHALAHGSVIGALLGVAVVYTRRTVFPLKRTMLSQWKYSRCRMFIAVSRAVARQGESIVRKDIIRVVADGVDWTRPGLSREAARRALGIPDERFVVGTIGHFTREKNLPLIAEAARALAKTHPHVLFVGIGPYAMTDAPPPANLMLVGHKPDAVDYYGAFDLYASASTQEGLGSALLDAVVRDIPIVAIDAGGTRDVVADTRVLVSPQDGPGFIAALAHAIDCHGSARFAAVECGKRARDLFSVESMVEKNIQVYREILS